METEKQARMYQYSYDRVNRLISAAYSHTGGAGGENYTLPQVSYDKNGNILSLHRDGLSVMFFFVPQRARREREGRCGSCGGTHAVFSWTRAFDGPRVADP